MSNPNPSLLDIVAAVYPAAPTFNFSDSEIPGGSVNGTNVTFTLVHSPNPANSLILSRNGVIQKQGTDYTISGLTITFTAAPLTGDILFAWYRF